MCTRRGSWTAIALIWVLVAAVVGVTGSGFAATGWQSRTEGIYTVWAYNDIDKFRFDTSLSQWQHSGLYGTQWNIISATGLTYTGNIGDGYFHTLGNGYWIQYNTAYNLSFFKDGPTLAESYYRFRYMYGSGQWESSANTLLWRPLGAARLSGAFLGSGDWYNLGNGFTYRYLAADDIGTFKDGAYERFRYRYATLQWENTGDTASSWQALGASGLSAAFLGSGGWWSLGNGFWYQYSASNDIGWFKDGNTLATSFYRFRYYYGASRWESSANTLYWRPLGVTGLSAAFVGSGDWYNLGNGFTYQYLVEDDIGTFRDGTHDRFRYRYATLQWENTGDTASSWQALGNTGLSAAFLGSGAWWSLGNGFWYQYLANCDMGWYKDGSTLAESYYRFRYYYGPSRWESSANTLLWRPLGAAGVSAAFVGSGDWYNLGNGFTYQYLVEDDIGTFRDGTHDRFRYRYAALQWENTGDTASSWQALGNTGLSAAFLGSGAWWNLGNGFWYQYLANCDMGWYKDGSTLAESYYRFRYHYGPGQWENSANTLYWRVLGKAGLTADFVGDGQRRQVYTGNQWWYQYDSGSDIGSWSRLNDDASKRFSYAYASGQWTHYGWSDGFATFGSPMNAAFIGNSGYYLVSAAPIWYYSYSYGDDRGVWSRYDGSAYNSRLSYSYTTGQWSQWDATASVWGALGEAASLGDIAFFGDGVRRQVISGAEPWWYRYDYTLDMGNYYRTNNDADLRFGFWSGTTASPASGWAHFGQDGVPNWLGEGTLSNAPFLVDWTMVRPDPWYFSYDYEDDFGTWSRSAGPVDRRLSYDYVSGQWWHYNLGGSGASLGSPTPSAAFAADGLWLSPSETNWYYSYNYDDDRGIWSRGSSYRFGYAYATGQWSHYDSIGSAWVDLGYAASLADIAFYGDGARRQIPLNPEQWWYSYDYGNDRGQYYKANADAALRFSYGYVSGMWSHHDASGGEGILSEALSLSLVPFIGGEGWYQVSSVPWYYHYNFAADTGLWALAEGGADQRFSYSYLNRQWTHYDWNGGQATLGGAISLSETAFMGDGGWHLISSDPDPVWYYSYAVTDKGRWARSGSEDDKRFVYEYSTGYWSHAGWSGGASYFSDPPNSISLSALPFIGDGDLYSKSAGWWYAYDYEFDTGLFCRANDYAALRFSYAYATGIWNHHDASGGAGTLSEALSLTAVPFIGSWYHEISSDPGWAYQYDYDGDDGYWYRSADASARFSYDYLNRQWSHWDRWGSSALLGPGATSLSTVTFMGDGNIHYFLGASWWYQYEAAADTGQWFRDLAGNQKRFVYSYADGKWSHVDKDGGSAVLSAPVSLGIVAFMGDGGYHDIGTWWYRYQSGTDTGEWFLSSGGSGHRFSYTYADSQWYHYGWSGGGSPLGPANVSLGTVGFMGDGGWHQVSSDPDPEWYYRYAGDQGYWSRSSSDTDNRFSYSYADGLWSHTGYNGGAAYVLGNYQLSLSDLAFVGDGGWHWTNMSGPWYYSYTYAQDKGYWSRTSDGANQRFSYVYASGVWNHLDANGGEGTLSEALSLGDVAFVGNESWNQISSNPWCYSYFYSLDKGFWALESGGTNLRFSYDYAGRQWTHYGWGSGLGATLGGTTSLTEVAFMGDDGWHQVSATPEPDWYYRYAGDQGYWSRSSSETDKRFSYGYGDGQWSHYGYDGGSATLGAPVSLSTLAFIGDGGDLHEVDAGRWWYRYDYANDRASFFLTFDSAYYNRFRYEYATGQWWHLGMGGGVATLGSPVSLSTVAFMGDGNVHEVTTGAIPGSWWYHFLYEGANRGEWFRDAGGTLKKFSYHYGTGQWRHYGYGSGYTTLGPASVSLTDVAFMGDANLHEVDAGTWWYKYVYENNRGDWYRDATGTVRKFSYTYVDGQWRHYGWGSGYTILGPANTSLSELAFMGDGELHTAVAGNWWYKYTYAGNFGEWFRDAGGTVKRFSYTYADGQWTHYGWNNGQTTLGSPVSLSVVGFMGDGNWNQVSGAPDPEWYYTYEWGSDFGRWARSANWDDMRFAYDYWNGDWFHFGYSSGSSYLTAPSNPISLSTVAFIGDGSRNGISSDWWYSYNYGLDRGQFFKSNNDLALRFSYAYQWGIWGHHDANDGGGQLSGSLSLSEVSFIGDGGWHQVSSVPWYYSYNYGADTGSWALASDGTSLRFTYEYLNGQWRHYDAVGGSALLGPGNTWLDVVSFMGDGNVHEVFTGAWWYRYAGPVGEGWWFIDAEGTQKRFSYGYASGQWSHHDGLGGGAFLGLPTNLSTVSFIGDGGLYEVIAGNWWYQYFGADEGNWFRDAAGTVKRFSYAYATGIWSHHDDHGGAGVLSEPLSLTTVAFIGDGGYYQVSSDPGWYYYYGYGYDDGYWASVQAGDETRFFYDYNLGQWGHFDSIGGCGYLTPQNIWLNAVSFIGDGSRHDISGGGNSWWYKYDYEGDSGWWYRANDDTTLRFSFDHSIGQWTHYDGLGGSALLGSPVSLSTVFFMGDGYVHQVVSGNWWYRYLYGTDEGDWSTDAGGGTKRFSYAYADGQWSHYGWNSGSATLGPGSTSLSTIAFMGDGEFHLISPEPYQWYYKYIRGENQGYWYRSTAEADKRYSYLYGGGYWQHYGTLGGYYISSVQVSLTECPFMGNGNRNGKSGYWWYRYAYDLDRAEYYRAATGDGWLRFSYAFTTGIWSHHDANGGSGEFTDALALSATVPFVGLGNWYQISSHPWYYRYDYTSDTGSWALNADGSNQRFGYDYINGQWSLFGYFSTTGQAPFNIGPSGLWLNAVDSFMGDGSRHNISSGGNEWWFKYDGTYSRWYRADDDATLRFFFWNQIGYWGFSDGHGYGEQLNYLTTPGFIGDGMRHALYTDATWKLLYNYGADELRFIHNGETDDNTWNYLAYAFSGAYSWYDSYTDGAVQARYLVDSFRFANTFSTGLNLYRDANGYYMEYSLAGDAADRYARYYESGTGNNFSKYVYATTHWWGWDGSDFTLDWDPGASNLYRVPPGP